MKKMKSSMLVVCIAGNLACGSSNHLTAQEITFPDMPSRIADSVSNLETSKAAACGSVAQPQGATSFGRQGTVPQVEAGSITRKSLSNERNAALAKSGVIGQSGRTSSAVTSAPKSDSMVFSLKATQAGQQGQIGMAPSRSARSTPLAEGQENTSINLDVFSQSRLVD